MVKLQKNLVRTSAIGRFLCLAMLLMYGSRCAAVTDSKPVVLAWAGSPDSSVAGYAVYYGTSSGVYTTRLDLGTNTVATVPGLRSGANYYFIVTAYDATGLESPPSNEIIVSPPVQLHLTLGTAPASPVSLGFFGATGHWYELQATVDLQNWTTIWQSSLAIDNSWLQYQELKTYSQRFYRLVVH